MNFQELLARMQELDAPKAVQPVETAAEDCGMPMAPSMPPKPEDKPSMTVNITAQGDAIEDILKLMAKVNPDMNKASDAPSMPAPMPMPITIKPINKLIPDFDGDNDDKPGGEMDSDYNGDGKLDRHEKDHADEKPLLKTLDIDHDGDHDMDDHDMEKDDEEDKEEAYANEPDEDERDIEFMTKKMSGGMNRMKATHPKVAGGDNPMQRVKEGEDLLASIRAELLRALEETKGAK
jgi:hypothetical protein